MLGFVRRRKNQFPKDTEGRRKVMLDVHRELAGNDILDDPAILDFLLEQISDEEDPFILDSYVIFYLGTRRPFRDCNNETAKKIADMVLADAGWEMPQDEHSFKHLDNAFSNMYSIDAIAEWQRKHVRKL